MDIREYINGLIGQRMYYGIKSPDTELYGFGFVKTDRDNDIANAKDDIKTILHVMCRFRVIWRDGSRQVETFYEDTDPCAFAATSKHLIGLKVQRVGLSSKNDLWLDFGKCRIVFATLEDELDSWCLFASGGKGPFLLASNTAIEFI